MQVIDAGVVNTTRVSITSISIQAEHPIFASGKGDSPRMVVA